jgi:transposase
MQILIADIRAQWQELDRRIAAFDAEFVAFAKEDQDARRLSTIPGIGALNATALTAAIGKAEAFEHGRDLSAWLGLVPRQATTGGRPKLFGISKRGTYLAERDTALGRWAKGLLARVHKNVAVVALANKLARIAWAVLRHGEKFAAKGLPSAA